MLLHNYNFQQEYPEISNKIQSSDFISLDLEFTGLYKKDPIHQLNYFSPIESVYSALRESVLHYNILQVGCSIFHTTENCNKLSSFYFHPNNGADLMADPESLTFLLFNKYDFLKTFTNKLSFVSPSHFNNVLKDSCKKKSNETDSSNPHKFYKLLKKSDYFDYVKGSEEYVRGLDGVVKSYIESFLNNISNLENKSLENEKEEKESNISFKFDLDIDKQLKEKFYSTTSNNNNSNQNNKTEEEKEKEIKSFVLKGKHNAKDLILKFMKVLIKKHKSRLKATNYRMEYSFVYDIQTENKLDYTISIRDKQFVKTEKKNKVLDTLFKKNYSSRIVKDLLLSGKPIVLHSGGFDLLFLIQNFIFELPETYNEFVEKLYLFQGRHLYTQPVLKSGKDKEASYREVVKLEKEFDNLEIQEKQKYYKFRLFDTKYLMYLQFNDELLKLLKVERLGNLGSSFELLTNYFKDKGEENMIYKSETPDLVESGLSAHHAGFDAEITGKVFYFVLKALNLNLESIDPLQNQIFLYNSFTTFNLKNSIKSRNNYYKEELEKIVVVKDDESEIEKSMKIDEIIKKNEIKVKRTVYFNHLIKLHIPTTKNSASNKNDVVVLKAALDKEGIEYNGV